MPKQCDLTGQRFGKLVVIEKSASEKMWVCQCDCGNTAVVTTRALKHGNKKSCGCMRKRVYPKNLSGLTFGALTVVDYDTPSYTKAGQKETRFKCKCECGCTISVFRSNLVCGKTQSCGCRYSYLGTLKHRMTRDERTVLEEARIKRKKAREDARIKCQEVLGMEIDKASDVVHLNCDMQDFTPENLWYTKHASTLNSRLDQFRGLGFRNNDDGSFVTDSPELMSCALMLFRLQDLIRSNGGVV